MALSITHQFVSAIADGGNASLVQPSNWNASHSITGLGTGVQTFLETPTSANLAAALTDETGSGSAVFSAAPTISGTATFTGSVVGTADANTFGLTTLQTGILRSTGEIFVVAGGSGIDWMFNGNANNFIVASDIAFCWTSTGHNAQANASTFQSGTDTFLTRAAAASLRLGAGDAASPVAQTLQVQNVVAGTSNTSGVNWTFIGSLSTGSGTSGDFIFQTGGTGAGATSQNAATTAMTIKGATQQVVFAGTPRINTTPSAVTHTVTIASGADSVTNFGHVLQLNMNGTTYFIPCGTVQP